MANDLEKKAAARIAKMGGTMVLIGDSIESTKDFIVVRCPSGHSRVATVSDILSGKPCEKCEAESMREMGRAKLDLIESRRRPSDMSPEVEAKVEALNAAIRKITGLNAEMKALHITCEKRGHLYRRPLIEALTNSTCPQCTFLDGARASASKKISELESRHSRWQ